MRRALFLLLGILLSPSVAGAEFRVLGVDPAPQSLSADRLAAVVVRLSSPVAGVPPEAFRVLGRWSGPVPGTLLLEEGGARLSFTPARPFAAGEWVTVQVARTLRSAAGDSLRGGHAWSFWIATQPGRLDLREEARVPVRRAGDGSLKAYGACACDLDGDGLSDLAVPCEISSDVRLFLNDGGGGYTTPTVVPLPFGNFPSPIEAGDFDLDGIADFAIGNAGNDVVSVLFGNGAGGFRPEVPLRAALTPRGLAVLDADADGDDDVVTANRSSSTLTLLRNRGDGTFEPAVLFEAGANETAVSVADANGDGILDLFVGLHVGEEIAILLGDGEGGFGLAGTARVRGRPWSTAAGDVNGDGHADVASVNVFGNNVTVILGDGEGGFGEAVEYGTGGFPVAVDLGDLDGDGDLDLVTSGATDGEWSIFGNAGDGSFLEPFRFGTSGAACATLHDRDGDGTLDVTGVDEDDDLLVLFTNTPRDAVPAPVLRSFPNPFSDSARILYDLETSADVLLRVYDAQGALVRTLVHGTRGPGAQEVSWDGLDDRSRKAAAGFYLCRLDAGTGAASWRMILAR